MYFDYCGRVKNGMDFCCGMRFVSLDAASEGIGEHLVIKNTTSVMVLITAATAFRSTNPKETVEATLAKASTHSFDALTTEERLKRIDAEHSDNGLLTTYFAYGRYLLLSSSRGDCLPANLQGIWNRDISAPWGSKYTININTEMNYWPANSCNLAEC